MRRRRYIVPVLAAAIFGAGAALLAISIRGTFTQYTPLDIRAMAAFDFNPSTGTTADVPSPWRAFDGKKVAISGETYCPQGFSNPDFDFQLVYTISHPSFGGPPRVQERIFCHVSAAQRSACLPTNFAGQTWGPVTVYGTLHVAVTRSNNSDADQVYSMDVDRMENQPVNSTSSLADPPFLRPWQQGSLAAIMAVILAWAAVQFLRYRMNRQRIAAGAVLCPCCGYDVRATPRQCPECGAKL